MNYLSNNAIGYGLFFALNMTAMWLGVMPFIDSGVQTIETSTTFFAGSITFELSFFCIAIFAAARPAFTKRFLFLITAIPWLIGMALLSFISIAPTTQLALWFVCGLFLGWGTAGTFLAWQKAFFTNGPSTGTQENMAGTLVACAIYIALSYLPPAPATTFIIFAISVCSVVLLWAGLNVNTGQETQEERNDGHEKQRLQLQNSHKRYLKDYWRTAVCLGVLGFCCAAIRCLATTDASESKVANALSMLALMIATLIFFFIWRKQSITLSTSNIFRLIAPTMLLLLLLVPILGNLYVTLLSGVLFALLGSVVMLTSAQCLTAAAERKLDPVFTYGIVSGILWTTYDIGHLFAETGLRVTWLQDSPLACTALLCACVIGLGLFLGQGGAKAIASPQFIRVEKIELMRTAGSPQLRNRETGSDLHTDDAIAQRMKQLSARYFLTPREAEITELVARGMTVKQIAQKLSLSENTIRGTLRALITSWTFTRSQH